MPEPERDPGSADWHGRTHRPPQLAREAWSTGAEVAGAPWQTRRPPPPAEEPPASKVLRFTVHSRSPKKKGCQEGRFRFTLIAIAPTGSPPTQG